MDEMNAEFPHSRRRLLSRTISESNKSLLEHSHTAPIVCFVTQPNNNVFQVEIDHRGEVQAIIEKVCKELGIINEEAEYFGLQYTTQKNQMIWLNNRNRVSKQIPKSSPYQLYIKVKYFVDPHILLLEETRYACFWPDSRGEIPADVIRMAADIHKQFEEKTVTKARWDLLHLVSENFPSYGTHFCEAKDIFDHRILIGVGPENVITCSSNNTITNKFPYCRINRITTSHRIVILDLLEDDGSVQARHYKLSSTRLADTLYRLITEVHAFFRCDTIPRHVLQQTTRDLKDTIVSIFDHNVYCMAPYSVIKELITDDLYYSKVQLFLISPTRVGKTFAFDVLHTCREVYDRALRHLYHSTNSTTDRSPGQPSYPPCLSGGCDQFEPTKGAGAGDISAITGACGQESSSTPSEPLLFSQGELKSLLRTRLQELTLCRLCMDKSIDRVFLPCGHAISCEQCSEMVEICSICRVPIENRHVFYLPMDLDAVLQEPLVRRSMLRHLTLKSPTDSSRSTNRPATGGTAVSCLTVDSTDAVSHIRLPLQQQLTPPLPVPSSCNMISQPLTSYLTFCSSSAPFDVQQTALVNHSDSHSTSDDHLMPCNSSESTTVVIIPPNSSSSVCEAACSPTPSVLTIVREQT